MGQEYNTVDEILRNYMLTVDKAKAALLALILEVLPHRDAVGGSTDFIHGYHVYHDAITLNIQRLFGAET